MSVAVDTNILVRALVDDDPVQGAAARAILSGAHRVAVPITALCETVWVLSRAHRVPRREIATMIRRLFSADTVRIDRGALAAGLLMLDADGDFADGVIAYEGRELGGVTFLSFDREAVDLLVSGGMMAACPPASA